MTNDKRGIACHFGSICYLLFVICHPPEGRAGTLLPFSQGGIFSNYVKYIVH